MDVQTGLACNETVDMYTKRILTTAAILLLGIIALIIHLFPSNVYARSGCCSHHGGVCGCGCCDGTGLSDTCAPYYPQCSQPRYIAPIITKAPIIYTPKPSTPKPTTRLTPKPTLNAVIDASYKPKQSDQPNVSNTNPTDTLLGLGMLGSVGGGLIWGIRKIIKMAQIKKY